MRWLVSAFSATCLIASAPATRADEFYKGRTISIIVGASPGGGHDAWARALARFMPGHIPGRPAMIVQNMPGAGNMVTARSVNTTQARDGTVMAGLNAGVLTQAVVQPDRVNLDLRKFAWIGVAARVFTVCYGYGPNGVSSWDDLMRRAQFIVGTTGKGSLSYSNSATLREIFGAPIKLIMGYPGSSESRLALERGELEGDCTELSSIPLDWIGDGRARLFVRFTRERPANMPESARYINDFATTREQIDVLDLLNASNELGRPFVMSGETPAELVAIMRKAFDDTMKDANFLAESARQGLPVSPVAGVEAAGIVDRIMSISPETIARAKKIYE